MHLITTGTSTNKAATLVKAATATTVTASATASWDSDKRMIVKPQQHHRRFVANNQSIREAVSWMCSQPVDAIAEYGEMNTWDTSQVTDMKGLFSHQALFNHNISNWDVSHVLDMSYMFYHAESFNSNLSKWNVCKVQDRKGMFTGALAFNHTLHAPPAVTVPVFVATNQSIREAVTIYCKDKLYGIAQYGEINTWDTSNVTDMSGLFKDQTYFNENINHWNVSNVTDMSCLFHYAISF